MSRDRFSALEVTLVIGIAFGYAIYGGLSSLYYNGWLGSEGADNAYSSGHLWFVVVFELATLPFLVAILFVGGWRAKDFPVSATWKATGIGAAVAAVAWLVNFAGESAVYEILGRFRIGDGSPNDYAPSSAPDFLAIVAVSLVNPLYEEFLVCGYIVAALAPRFGVKTAVLTSTGLRTLYHLYQGVTALPFHIAYGLLQGWVLVRWKNLWPLLVSHAILDFVGLVFFLL